jgi:hypothetical protein
MPSRRKFAENLPKRATRVKKSLRSAPSLLLPRATVAWRFDAKRKKRTKKKNQICACFEGKNAVKKKQTFWK